MSWLHSAMSETEKKTPPENTVNVTDTTTNGLTGVQLTEVENTPVDNKPAVYDLLKCFKDKGKKHKKPKKPKETKPDGEHDLKKREKSSGKDQGTDINFIGIFTCKDDSEIVCLGKNKGPKCADSKSPKIPKGTCPDGKRPKCIKSSEAPDPDKTQTTGPGTET